MTPDIIAKAHAVLAGADRNDDAKALARWVLERVAEDRPRYMPHARDCNWRTSDCDCWVGADS